MDSGHPALVIPYAGTPTLPPRRVLIAWDGSREAARATTMPYRCWAWPKMSTSLLSMSGT